MVEFSYLLNMEPVQFFVQDDRVTGSDEQRQRGEFERDIGALEISPFTEGQDVEGGNQVCATTTNLCTQLKAFFASERRSSSDPALKKLAVGIWNVGSNLSGLGIQLKADFFRGLVCLFGEDLTLKVVLSKLNHTASLKGGEGEDQVIATDYMTACIGTDGVVTFKHVIQGFPVIWRHLWLAGHREASLKFGAQVSIILSATVPEGLTIGTGITCHSFAMIKKIRARPLGKDMKVVAQNGVEIPCHKAFLAVQSEELDNIIEKGLDADHNLIMHDISEVGVEAFLDYAYFGGLDKAKDNCDVAFELLQVAKKYSIATLEIVATGILLEMPSISVSSAFRLFFYAKRNTNMNALKDKSLFILKSKRDELTAMDEYKALFSTNAEDAVELCTAFLYT